MLKGPLHTDETFTGARWVDERIEGLEFDSCVFERCVLHGSTFAHCRFGSCRFIGCDLSNAKVPSTRFRDVEFRSTKLIGIDWTKADGMSDRAAMASTTFTECVLDLSSFYGLNLRGTTMERCSAKEIDLTEADLRDAVCRGTDFAGARFHGTDLENADLSGALNYAIDPRVNKVKRARFTLPEAAALLRGLDVIIE